MYAPKVDKFCPHCGGLMTHYTEGIKLKRNRWRCKPCYREYRKDYRQRRDALLSPKLA